jgi:hypothetical protein
MSKPGMNSIRNVIAGLLVGYGFVSFFCYLALVQRWTSMAPSRPDEILGLIYRHNQHGSYTYFSRFQATTDWLMFSTSIPLAFIGAFTAPKKHVTGKVRWYAVRFKWDQDDPLALMKWTMLVSAAATPFFVFFAGPYIIQALNAVGLVMNLG